MISSQIEGTQATLMDLFAFEAAAKTESARTEDVQQVCNYLDAIAYARKQLRSPKGLPLLPEHPIVTIGRVVGLLATTKPTANKAVAALVDAGVLVENTGRRRDRAFGYAAYLDRLRAGTEI